MDWKDVGKLIAPLAPMAGSILGGLIPFPGGSIIGQKLGEMIAGAFGVAPTPAAVSEAVANSTEETARVKINAAVAQARAEIEGFVEVEEAYLHAVEVGLAQTGETMRLELRPENRHWFFTGWRPASGWVFVVYATAFGAILMLAGVMSAFFGKPEALDRLSNAWPIYAAYFGTLAAMVGVYVVARTADKVSGVDTTAAKPATPKPPPPPAKPVLSTPKPPARPAPVIGRD